jgi:hypothetical protein
MVINDSDFITISGDVKEYAVPSPHIGSRFDSVLDNP